jgi:PBP1b-binding outer membrane lipoprotein LpoB
MTIVQKQKRQKMKKVTVIIAISVFFIGCNMNPSKEARIQKLETEIQQSMEKINQFKERIEILEEMNTGLQLKIQ